MVPLNRYINDKLKLEIAKKKKRIHMKEIPSNRTIPKLKKNLKIITNQLHPINNLHQNKYHLVQEINLQAPQKPMNLIIHLNQRAYKILLKQIPFIKVISNKTTTTTITSKYIHLFSIALLEDLIQFLLIVAMMREWLYKVPLT